MTHGRPCTCVRCEGQRARTALRATTKPCPSCGCYRYGKANEWCVLALDGGGMGLCAPAGVLSGYDVCSACLAPERRLPPGAWYLPDEETTAALLEAGLIEPNASWLELRARAGR